MIFHPQGLMKTEGCFILPPNAVASAHACLDKEVIVADWQYNCKQTPVETVSVFRNAGFDCLACPWDRGIAQMRALLETVKSYASEGFIHTTGHRFCERSCPPKVITRGRAGVNSRYTVFGNGFSRFRNKNTRMLRHTGIF